jgi:hypothetical protein
MNVTWHEITRWTDWGVPLQAPWQDLAQAAPPVQQGQQAVERSVDYVQNIWGSLLAFIPNLLAFVTS